MTLRGDKHVNFDSKAELCETHFCKMNSCLEGLGGSGLHAEFGGDRVAQPGHFCISRGAGRNCCVLLPFLLKE